MPEEYLGPEEGEPTAGEASDLPVDEAPAESAAQEAAEEPVAEEPVAEEPASAAPAGPPPPQHPNMNWYIIHTYSGFEQKVRESLRSRAQAFGFADQLGEILIPTEEVVEMRNGKKVTSKRLLYPGYVLVQLQMDESLWHAVKETPRVTGFVGGGKDPVPLTADEVNSVLYRQTSSAERPRPKLSFDKGETVRITEGPFANFSGRVDEVNTERDTLRVLVTIFGRSTPVELDFLQVEKLN
jgi:transcriptional antiterminator NusG